MNASSARSNSCFIDTSAYYAVANRNDEHHAEALAIQARAVRERRSALTTNLVLGETYTLMLNRLGRRRAYEALSVIRASAVVITRVELLDEERAWAIIEQFEDKAFSFVDATSFAVRERLGSHMRSPLIAPFSSTDLALSPGTA